MDIDLGGLVYVHDRTHAVVRPGEVNQFVLVGRDEAAYGTCRDVTGVFREQAAPPVPQVRLLGCRREPPLLSANPNDFALVALLGLLRLRIFEACGASMR